MCFAYLTFSTLQSILFLTSFKCTQTQEHSHCLALDRNNYELWRCYLLVLTYCKTGKEESCISNQSTLSQSVVEKGATNLRKAVKAIIWCIFRKRRIQQGFRKLLSEVKVYCNLQGDEEQTSTPVGWVISTCEGGPRRPANSKSFLYDAVK